MRKDKWRFEALARAKIVRQEEEEKKKKDICQIWVDYNEKFGDLFEAEGRNEE